MVQSAIVPGERTNSAAPSVIGPANRSAGHAPGGRRDAIDRPAGGIGGLSGRASAPGLLDIRAVAHLIPAARAARASLASGDRSLSRDNLADAMREDGHGVSNERASLLVKILKAELEVAGVGAASARPHAQDPEPLSEAVA